MNLWLILGLVLLVLSVIATKQRSQVNPFIANPKRAFALLGRTSSRIEPVDVTSVGLHWWYGWLPGTHFKLAVDFSLGRLSVFRTLPGGEKREFICNLSDVCAIDVEHSSPSVDLDRIQTDIFIELCSPGIAVNDSDLEPILDLRSRIGREDSHRPDEPRSRPRKRSSSSSRRRRISAGSTGSLPSFDADVLPVPAVALPSLSSPLADRALGTTTEAVSLSSYRSAPAAPSPILRPFSLGARMLSPLAHAVVSPVARLVAWGRSRGSSSGETAEERAMKRYLACEGRRAAHAVVLQIRGDAARTTPAACKLLSEFRRRNALRELQDAYRAASPAQLAELPPEPPAALVPAHAVQLGVPWWARLLCYRFTAWMYVPQMRRRLQTLLDRLVLIYCLVSLLLALLQLHEALPAVRQWVHPVGVFLHSLFGGVVDSVWSWLRRTNWLFVGVLLPFRRFWASIAALLLVLRNSLAISALGSLFSVVVSTVWPMLQAIAGVQLLSTLRATFATALSIWRAVFGPLVSVLAPLGQAFVRLTRPFVTSVKAVATFARQLARPNLHTIVEVKHFVVNTLSKLSSLIPKTWAILRNAWRRRQVSTSTVPGLLATPGAPLLSPPPLPHTPSSVGGLSQLQTPVPGPPLASPTLFSGLLAVQDGASGGVGVGTPAVDDPSFVSRGRTSALLPENAAALLRTAPMRLRRTSVRRRREAWSPLVLPDE